MFRIHLISLALGFALAGFSASAATLGLSTSAPTIGAQGTVDYFEFGPDGDLSMFGAPTDVSSLTTLDVASGAVEFAVGFDLANPFSTASGGFAVTDVIGTYLAGDLVAMGSRAFGTSRSIVELRFDILSGRGASEWTPTLLINVIFDGLGPDPFAGFLDGEFYDVEIGMFAVVGGDTPTPAPIPLPAGLVLMLSSLGAIASCRIMRTSQRCAA